MLINEDMIVTLDDTTSNVKASSNIRALQGVMTRVDTGAIKIVAEEGLIVPQLTETERDAIVSPENGATIYNSTDDEMNFFYNNQWNGSVYGNMFQINNAIATTINTVGVFEDVLNFSQGELKETTFASDTLTTGSVSTAYMVNYSACIDGSTGNTFEMAIEVDGTVRDESHACATVATGGKDVNLAGSFILTIGVSKDIKLVIANKTNTNNPTVLDASVSIVGIR